MMTFSISLSIDRGKAMRMLETEISQLVHWKTGNDTDYG